MTALKEGTADLHAEAETHVGILDPAATEPMYAEYLARMLGFHTPLEHAFAAHSALAAAGFDAPGRAKRTLLARDLAALGVEAESIAHCAAPPALGSLERALGAAYVIEGSTLGGKYILHRIRGHYRHLFGRATHFLTGYGEKTGARWKQFCAITDAHLRDDVSTAAALAGARDTFRSLITWLAEPGVPLRQEHTA